MRSILIILATTAVVALPARAERFEIGPEAGDTHVVFESKAPMETFQGKTDHVSGTIDPDAVDGAIALRVVVDMASLDTGIGLRNRHMCENHLHTEQYPDAVFEGAKIVEGDAAALSAAGDHDVTLEGDLTLHGVTRTIRVPARISRTTVDGAARIGLSAEFDVALTDYEIPRPRMLMLKLNEIQRVRVELWGAPAAGAAAATEAAGEEAPGTR